MRFRLLRWSLISRQIHASTHVMNSQNSKLQSAVKCLPPLLAEGNHKGQAGRIGIIGGSREYTGAPYFAGITALRCGADLVYVFCTKDAAGPIKSYAPELIVLPYLDHEQGFDLIIERLANLHSLVIGPGLGVNSGVHLLVLSVIQYIKENEKIQNMPLVLDADSIGLVAKNNGILKDYKGTVYLTPNINEVKKLTDGYLGRRDIDEDDWKSLQSLVHRINENAILVLKGKNDQIISSNASHSCSITGSLRRVGGQGDLLSGSLGLFSYWANLQREVKSDISVQILAAYSACAITRLCSRYAYEQKNRSLITSDMIDQVKNAFETCFNG